MVGRRVDQGSNETCAVKLRKRADQRVPPESPRTALRVEVEVAAATHQQHEGTSSALPGPVKKRLRLPASLYEILQILSLTMFERLPLDQLLAQAVADDVERISDKQLILFE
jgi:hypothetical protein